MRRRPDVIVSADDLYQGEPARFPDRLEAFRELLAGLESARMPARPGGRRFYLSRGVGLERGQAPPPRLLAPPEVSVLTLR